MNDYNGWKNYETWNVALWIGNNECLYHLAKEHSSYDGFLMTMQEIGSLQTPDGVAWNDPVLDREALSDMLEEL